MTQDATTLFSLSSEVMKPSIIFTTLLMCMSFLMANGDYSEEYSLTWNSEGNDNPNSIYYTKKFTVPSARSGLTIGRGYDMREKKKDLILKDFINAGVPRNVAEKISNAGGLFGDHASTFIEKNNLKDFVLTDAQQKGLFKIAIERKLADVKRICHKDDVVEAYGKANFDAMHSSIRSLLVDLRYRGDYTGTTRKFLQKPIVDNDVKKLKVLMSDSSLWGSVPRDRFQRRKALMETAAKQLE